MINRFRLFFTEKQKCIPTIKSNVNHIYFIMLTATSGVLMCMFNLLPTRRLKNMINPYTHILIFVVTYRISAVKRLFVFITCGGCFSTMKHLG